MARHRIGDSYLSDTEYAEHQSTNWAIGLFLFFGVLSGLVVYFLTDTIETKYLRFGLVICSGLFVGFLSAVFSKIIRVILGYAIGLLFLYLIGMLIWNVM